MSYQICQPGRGACFCILGDRPDGPARLEVWMLSAGGALLDGGVPLGEGERIRAAVEIPQGPRLELTGQVVRLEEGRPLVQWVYEDPSKAEVVDSAIRAFAERLAKRAAAARARPGWKRVKSLRSGGKGPRRGGIRAGEKAGCAGGRAVRSGEKIDLRATLRKKAKVVRAAELASRHETLQVFDFQTIKDLIKEAVAEAIEFLGPSIAEASRERLLEEAEAGFREKARLYEAEKADLEKRIQLLQEEISRSRANIQAERARVLSAYQFTVSDKGMMELEDRLGRVLERALRMGSAGKGLEDELRQIVSRLLDDEREKIREQAQRAQSDKIALLEKKVERLASTLRAAEDERDRARKRAQVLEASGGVFFGNLYDAGIDEDDPNRERKLLLMKEIFEFNKRVREELAACGITLPVRGEPGAEK
ncbi:MAG: hypothetical protein ACUVYA_10610, partial [Planctomycetota bacterium]